jgi:hypothetical protein
MPKNHVPNPNWNAKHFSQANPRGRGQGNVPRLLRRVANTLAILGEIEVQDLVMHTEITPDGAWPSVTVYYHSTARSRNRVK